MTAELAELPAQLYGCECDLDHRCDVAECVMRGELEARHYGQFYRGLITAGFDPRLSYADNAGAQ